jgi:ubiquinone/menaquinone biosynthesis C-methylase UbiE
MDVKESVRQQFGRVAANYATSAVHVSGPELAAMLEAWPLRGDETLLDAGTGTGHTALAFAPLVGRVVAVDLTEPMLEQGRRLAEERGLANVDFRQADVEHLPFPDASFDLVVSRFSLHHTPHPAIVARELARVLKPGGGLLLLDVVSPNDPATDTFLNAVEVLRDTSHVRDHTVAQWLWMLEAEGLVAEAIGSWPLRLEFESWVRRMETPAQAIAQIRALLDAAPSEVRSALRVEHDHSFTVPMSLVRAIKPEIDRG